MSFVAGLERLCPGSLLNLTAPGCADLRRMPFGILAGAGRDFLGAGQFRARALVSIQLALVLSWTDRASARAMPLPGNNLTSQAGHPHDVYGGGIQVTSTPAI
jgi:hypothetical protein